MNEVASIYDNLFSFESKKKRQSYPIHKKLNFENFNSIPEWLLSKVEFNDGDKILDAGCGTGHTLFLLNESRSIVGKGISISPKEVAFASEQNKISNLTFDVFDFDNPLDGVYDKIIAIESLKHSKSLHKTIGNFSSCLSSGGEIIVADDFLINNPSGLKRHKKYWKATSFGKLKTLRSYLNKTDDFDIKHYNLSEKVPSRSFISLSLLIVFFSFFRILTLGSLNRNIKTYLGGLLLERLYAVKAVEYHVLIAKKLK